MPLLSQLQPKGLIWGNLWMCLILWDSVSLNPLFEVTLYASIQGKYHQTCQAGAWRQEILISNHPLTDVVWLCPSVEVWNSFRATQKLNKRGSMHRFHMGSQSWIKGEHLLLLHERLEAVWQARCMPLGLLYWWGSSQIHSSKNDQFD